MPIHIYQQRKYESRLSTLPIAIYEQNKVVFTERLSRKRNKTSFKETIQNTQFIPNRQELKIKYGYDVSKTQLLPYSSALIQIPIHLTMYISLMTMYNRYPLWNQGGFKLFNNDNLNFINLGLTDSTLILPLTIGCTMGILQYIMKKKNKSRSVGIKENQLFSINIISTVLITYLSMSWSMGFNLYILSNLSSYIIQQKLMDSNIFRNSVGLNSYSVIQSDVNKLQIIYKCMNIVMRENVNKRQQHIENSGGDLKSSWNVLPQFQYSWIKVLSDSNNFKSLNPTQQQLNSIINDIKNVDNINQYEQDDEEEQKQLKEQDEEEQEQYSFEFTDKDELNKRRRQIRRRLKKENQTTRAFLMSQKELNEEYDDQYDDDEEEEDDEAEQDVIIQDVDNKIKEKKYN